MIKKILSVVLALTMVASLCGCNAKTTKAPETTTAANIEAEAAKEVTSEPATDVKKGVTYMWDTKMISMRILPILVIM